MFERKLGFNPSSRVKLELQSDLDFELGTQTLPELPLHFFSGVAMLRYWCDFVFIVAIGVDFVLRNARVLRFAESFVSRVG